MNKLTGLILAPRRFNYAAVESPMVLGELKGQNLIRFLSSVSAGIVFALAAFTSVSAQQVVDTELKATHGDWSIRCVRTNAQACVMTQEGLNAKGEPVLRVSFQRTPNVKDPKGNVVPAAMNVAAPLGVFLPTGLVAKIDGADAGAAHFKFCDPQACRIEELVSQKFITNLKKGANLVMTIHARDGSRADISLSLTGFTKAFASLE